MPVSRAVKSSATARFRGIADSLQVVALLGIELGVERLLARFYLDKKGTRTARGIH